jgi:LPXTG-motif cell wall-anchored protein
MSYGRILGGVATAAALILAPTGVASAYEGTDEAVLVSDTTPAPGEPFRVVAEAGTESPEATLTVTSQDSDVSSSSMEIAGTQSMTKDTTAGAAEFTVTLHAEGRYSVVGTDASGNVVGESVVVVGDGQTGEGDTGESDTGEGAAGGGSDAGSMLPDTGADAGTMALAGGGLALVLGGIAALVLSRRRKAELS